MVGESLELGAYSTLFKSSVKFGQQRVEANVPTDKEKSLQKSNRSLTRENDKLEEQNKTLAQRNDDLQKQNLNLTQQLKSNESRNQDLTDRDSFNEVKNRIAERQTVESAEPISPPTNEPVSVSSYRRASENPNNVETAGVVVNAFA